MIRFSGGFILALSFFFVAICLQADELKGKVQSVDAKKRVLQLTIDGKTKKYAVAKDVTVVSVTMSTKAKPSQIVPVEGGLASLKPGTPLTITTDTVEDKEVVSIIKLDTEIAVTDTKKKKKK